MTVSRCRPGGRCLRGPRAVVASGRPTNPLSVPRTRQPYRAPCPGAGRRSGICTASSELHSAPPSDRARRHRHNAPARTQGRKSIAAAGFTAGWRRWRCLGRGRRGCAGGGCRFRQIEADASNAEPVHPLQLGVAPGRAVSTMNETSAPPFSVDCFPAGSSVVGMGTSCRANRVGS